MSFENVININQLEPLGEGSYNKAYTYIDEVGYKWVIKIAQPEGLLFGSDTPVRSVRLFNEINRHFIESGELKKAELAFVAINKQKTVAVWACPFIDGAQADGAQISQELERIYLQTGRIVLDAISENNFLVDSKGRIICVDIGMAVLFDKGRRYSRTSNKLWENDRLEYQNYYNTYRHSYKDIIDKIEELLERSKMRCDLVKMLKNMAVMIKGLSNFFNYRKPSQVSSLSSAGGHEDLDLFGPGHNQTEGQSIFELRFSHEIINLFVAFIKKLFYSLPSNSESLNDDSDGISSSSSMSDLSSRVSSPPVITNYNIYNYGIYKIPSRIPLLFRFTCLALTKEVSNTFYKDYKKNI